jgi:hypothetical protein
LIVYVAIFAVRLLDIINIFGKVLKMERILLYKFLKLLINAFLPPSTKIDEKMWKSK